MKRVVGLVVSIIAAVGLTGCCCCFCSPEETSRQVAERIRTGPAQRETYRIERDEIEHAEVTVRFGGGTLDVKGGGDDLLDATFVYNLNTLEPVVEYEAKGTEGKLLIRHQVDEIQWDRSTEVRNEWQLVFGEQVPLDMSFAVGASSGTLDLGGLRLRRFGLEAGAADMTVRFSEPNPERLGSLGVRSGAARLRLLELGNANADELRFDGGLGTYTFDFQGEWQRSATAHIQAGASRVELVVPGDIGIKVCPGDLRRADYGGLEPEDGCYVNDRYAEADVRLDVHLDLGLGQLDVRQVN